MLVLSARLLVLRGAHGGAELLGHVGVLRVVHGRAVRVLRGVPPPRSLSPAARVLSAQPWPLERSTPFILTVAVLPAALGCPWL